MYNSRVKDDDEIFSTMVAKNGLFFVVSIQCKEKQVLLFLLCGRHSRRPNPCRNQSSETANNCIKKQLMSAAIRATVFCRHADGSNPTHRRLVASGFRDNRTHNTYASLRHWLGSATRIRRLPAGSLPSRFLLADSLIDRSTKIPVQLPPTLLHKRGVIDRSTKFLVQHFTNCEQQFLH